MFVNYKIKLKIISGKGGDGKNSFYKKDNKLIPNGGSGGNGGNVYFIINKKINNLSFFYKNRFFKSKNGFSGKSNFKNGKNGNNIFINLPSGVFVKNLINNKIILNSNNLKNKFLILKGGKGGLGNSFFKNKGLKGGFIYLELDYIIFNHIALIGFPNTGKSTFINFNSNIKSFVNSYPFTTLIPLKGVLIFNFYKKIFILDLPGIIKNSLNGLGLGLIFFKHLNFSKILLIFIDLFFLKKNIFSIFFFLKMTLYELYKYNKYYFYKSTILIFNKYDLILNFFSKKKFSIFFFINNFFFYKLFISCKKKFFYKKFFFIIYKNIF